MSNEKQLPPELVEKYERVIDEFDDSESIFRILHLKTKCAQIAVDYSEQRVAVLQESCSHFKNNCEAFKQQRDDLLHHVKQLNNAIDEYWNGERTDDRVKKINKIQQESL